MPVQITGFRDNEGKYLKKIAKIRKFAAKTYGLDLNTNASVLRFCINQVDENIKTEKKLP